MIALILAPFVFALLVFLYTRALNYEPVKKIKYLKFLPYLFGVFLFGGFFFALIGFLLPINISPFIKLLKRIFTKGGFYWLGFILYFLLSLLACVIVRTILKPILKKSYNTKIAKHITTVVVTFFTILMSIYGIVNAHNLHITNYEIEIVKKSKLEELNIVFISDLHLGYNVGVNEVKSMVYKINNLHPDIVIIGGDIFDNEYDALENPDQLVSLLKDIKAKYGTYATLGNHDIEEKILMGFTFTWSKEKKASIEADERMITFLKDSNIKLLYDEWLEIEDILIYGRPDGIKYNFKNTSRKSIDEFMNHVDTTKAIIVVDHEPSDSKLLQGKGVDLYLNGHTHNGQVWPGTLTIDLFWDNAYGYKKYDTLHNIVSSGVGLFGPNMRTGCVAEICNIKITFKK